MTTWQNAPRRTAAGRRGWTRRASWPPSLTLLDGKRSPNLTAWKSCRQDIPQRKPAAPNPRDCIWVTMRTSCARSSSSVSSPRRTASAASQSEVPEGQDEYSPDKRSADPEKRELLGGTGYPGRQSLRSFAGLCSPCPEGENNFTHDDMFGFIAGVPALQAGGVI